jgi:hypothetical protein
VPGELGAVHLALASLLLALGSLPPRAAAEAPTVEQLERSLAESDAGGATPTPDKVAARIDQRDMPFVVIGIARPCGSPAFQTQFGSRGGRSPPMPRPP